MAKVISEGIGKFCQHYPKIAVVVTAQAKGKENAMVAAWHTAISFEPPLYGISVSPKRFTYQLIAESREFGVNFLSSEAAELIAGIGGSTGRDIDKFQRFNIARGKSLKTTLPILEDAYAAYECKLVNDIACGDHNWLVGEIVAVHVMEGVFTAEEVLDLNKVSPILYLGKDRYLTSAKDTIRHLDREVYGVTG